MIAVHLTLLLITTIAGRAQADWAADIEQLDKHLRFKVASESLQSNLREAEWEARRKPIDLRPGLTRAASLLLNLSRLDRCDDRAAEVLQVVNSNLDIHSARRIDRLMAELFEKKMDLCKDHLDELHSRTIGSMPPADVEAVRKFIDGAHIESHSNCLSQIPAAPCRDKVLLDRLAEFILNDASYRQRLTGVQKRAHLADLMNKLIIGPCNSWLASLQDLTKLVMTAAMAEGPKEFFERHSAELKADGSRTTICKLISHSPDEWLITNAFEFLKEKEKWI